MTDAAHATILISGEMKDDGVGKILNASEGSLHDDDPIEDDDPEHTSDPRHASHLSYEEEVVDEDDDLLEEVIEEDDDVLEEEIVDESDGAYEEEVVDDDVVEEVVVDDSHPVSQSTSVVPDDGNQIHDEEIIVEDVSQSHNEEIIAEQGYSEDSHHEISHHEPSHHDNSTHKVVIEEVSNDAINKSNEGTIEISDVRQTGNEEIIDEIDEGINRTDGNSTQPQDGATIFTEEAIASSQEETSKDLIFNNQHQQTDDADPTTPIPTKPKDAPSSIPEPKLDDPDGSEPPESDIEGTTTPVVQDETTIDKTLVTDPPEMIPPIVLPLPEPVLIDPPVEDELMKPASASTDEASNAVLQNSLARDDGDELMGHMSEKNLASKLLSTAPTDATVEIEAIDKENQPTETKENDESQPVKLAAMGRNPQSQSVPPNTSQSPSKSLFGRLFRNKSARRPFDEHSEKDDPTDEGLLRAKEEAVLAANAKALPKKPVAPALRTLSKEETAANTNPNVVSNEPIPKPYDEMMAEDLTEGDNRPVVKITPMLAGDVITSPSDSHSDNASPRNDTAIATGVTVGAAAAVMIAASETAKPQQSVAPEPDIAFTPKKAVTSNEKSTQQPGNADVELGQKDGWADFSSMNERRSSANERKSSQEKPLLAGKIPNSSDGVGSPLNSTSNEPIQRSASNDNETGYWSSPFTKGLALLILIIVIALAVALPLTLNKKNDDGSRDIVIPTNPPISPSAPAATSSPTISPNLPSWAESTPPLVGDPGSGLGSAVGLDETLMAVGAPLTANGTVSTFRYDDSGSWSILNSLTGPEGGSQFGYSVEIQNPRMAVGCPFRTINGTLDSAGSVFVYQFSESNNSWANLGPEVRGDEDVFAAGEEFGHSVGLGTESSGVPILAVGAPRSNKDSVSERGRVYTFRGQDSGTRFSWESIDSTILGNAPYDWFGASLDVSTDGSRIIVGAPGNVTGGDGYARVFSWSGSEWIQDFEQKGSDGEECGQSVAFLTQTGDRFAIGSPGFQNYSGKVSVFTISSTTTNRRLGMRRSLIDQVGEDIIGNPGDRLGTYNTLKGASFNDTPAVVLSTAFGVVRTLYFDSGRNVWEPLFEDLNTGTGSVVVGSSSLGSGILASGKPDIDSLGVYTFAESTTTAPVSTTAKPTPTPQVSSAQPPAPSLDSPTTSETSNAPFFSPSSPTASSVPETSPSTPGAPSSLLSESPISITSSPVASIPQDNPTLSPETSPSVVSSTVPVAVSTSVPASKPSSNSSWTQTGGSFTPKDANWGYGSSVGFSASAVAIGAPLALQNGAVFVHDFDTSNGSWVTDASGQLFGENPSDEFGASLDMVDEILLVGAPSAGVSGATAASGLAYCYVKSSSTWSILGKPIQGNSNLPERFGSSVGISDNRWAIIGASGSNSDSKTEQGSVYIFRYEDSSAEWTLVQNISGITPQGGYGSAVDISSDGNQIIAGAPLADKGYATVYEWIGSEWQSVFLKQGDYDGEALGSSVKILSRDGSIFAVGSPNYNGTHGRVLVFEKGEKAYDQLGDPIVGLVGEQLGAIGMLSGGTRSDPFLLLGTALGEVKEFAWNSSTKQWSQNGPAVNTGYNALLQIASSPDTPQIIVGVKDDTIIYQQ